MPQITDYRAGHRYADGKPGRYVCFSSFEIDGVAYRIEEECSNPVHGEQIVWERESAILRQIGAPTREAGEA